MPPENEEQPPKNKGDLEEEYSLDDEEQTEVLWNKIRHKTQLGLWKAMSNIPLETTQHCCEKNHSNRQDLIQSLQFLYPLNDIWQGYIQFRNRMMEKYIISPDVISHLKTAVLCQYKDAPSTAIRLARLSRAIEIMLIQDMMILEEGYFPGCGMSFEEIDDIYLEKYMLELRAVLQAYREEKRKIAERYYKLHIFF